MSKQHGMESKRGLMSVLGVLSHLKLHVHVVETLHSLTLVTHVERYQRLIEHFLDGHSENETKNSFIT